MKAIIAAAAVWVAIIGLAVYEARHSTCHEESRLAISGDWATYRVCKGNVTGWESGERFIHWNAR